MHRNAIATLYGLEIRSLLRDRRTVVLSIILPIVVMPLFLYASTFMEKRRTERLLEKTYNYAVTGAEDETVLSTLSRALDETVPVAGRPDQQRLRFSRVAVDDPRRSLDDGKIDFYVEVVTGDAAHAVAREELKRSESRSDPSKAAATTPPEPDYGFKVFFRSDNSASRLAANAIVDAIRETRSHARAEALAARGFDIPFDRVAPVTADDVATTSQTAGARVSRFLTIVLVFLMMMGGATVASDIIAGEKERGTLETLLTTAAARSDIVAAKLLVVLTVTVVIIVLEFSSVLVYASLRIVDLPSNYEALLTPSTIATLVLLYLPVGALVSSVLLIISGFAKSYKEAQLYFFPVMLSSAVPAAAAVLPGLSLRSVIALVPVAGISVAVREVLTGRHDWIMLAVAWLSTAGAAVLLMRRAARMLSSENLITSADSDRAELVGGPDLFPKRVLRWFALMWVALFVFSSFEAALDLRLQVAINLLGLFLCGSLLMIRVYRLDPKRALALRMPHPMAFLAVVIGAPSGLLVSVGVARLASLVLPVPNEVLEQFGKQLFPVDVPLWQMLLFVAILPGICEEIAFRGVLLHGLRRRMRPVPLCLTVGLVFAMFHFVLFRLVPTAFLGVLLSAVTVLTGSIFPAMLWHATNNGLSILAALGEGSGIGSKWWHSALAVLPLLLSFWMLWRWRTPYPGVDITPRRDTTNTE